MKKIMDKLKNIFNYNKKVMLFLTIITIFGIITGAFFIVILNSNDKNMVIEYIQEFINNLNSFDYISSLKNSLLITFIITFSIWILGISIIGLLIVVLIIFWKSFTLGFTISSFIITYNLKGLLLAIIYVFPNLVINILILMFLSSYSIKLSLLIIKSIISKKKIELSKLMKKYTIILMITLIINIICSLYETFITPYILKGFATLLF